MTVNALPGGKEARQLTGLGGLDLLAQHRQRGAAQAPEHLRVAPLPVRAAGAQLAADKRALTLELTQRSGDVDAVPGTDVSRCERAVGGGVADEQAAQRVGHVLQEHGRQATRRGGPERIPVHAGVGGVDPPLLAR